MNTVSRRGIAIAAGLVLSGLLATASAAETISVTDCAGQRRVMERQLSDGSVPVADVAAVRAAMVRLDDVRRRLEAGAALDGPYAGAAHWWKLSLAAADPERAELFRRAARDQFARADHLAEADRTGWAAGLSDRARGIASAASFTRDWCGTDEDNTRWLKQQIGARGWFKRSTDGADADSAALQLVQHADRDKPFQKQVLELLGPLLKTGDTGPQSYARLFDRVAVGEGRPQRFGTQGTCTGPGTWTASLIEDPARLDQRRAEVGLEPMGANKRSAKECG